MDKVSILVCTYNRAESLRRTLNSFYALYPQCAAQVVVIDNNSTDDTPAVCAAFEKNGVIRLFQPVMGLSQARNFGLAHIMRPTVVFIDDDVTFHPGWLENLLAPFHDKKVAVVGGELLPVWERPKPEWLAGPWLHYYSVLLQWSSQPRAIHGHEWLCEGNIAFRRDVLNECGNFPVQLGRVGPVLLSGEGAVVDIIRHRGWQAIFTPRSVVDHHIAASRINPAWLTRRIFWQGITQSLIEKYIYEKTGHDSTRCQWCDLRLPTDMKTWAALLDPQVDDHFEHRMRQIHDLGYAMQKTGLIAG